MRLSTEILAEVVAAAVEHFPETAALQEALHLEELQGDRPLLMAMEITSLNEVQLAHFFSSQQWFAEAGVEPAQAAFLLAAALKPFYISLLLAAMAQTDFRSGGKVAVQSAGTCLRWPCSGRKTGPVFWSAGSAMRSGNSGAWNVLLPQSRFSTTAPFLH